MAQTDRPACFGQAPWTLATLNDIAEMPLDKIGPALARFIHAAGPLVAVMPADDLRLMAAVQAFEDAQQEQAWRALSVVDGLL